MQSNVGENAASLRIVQKVFLSMSSANPHFSLAENVCLA